MDIKVKTLLIAIAYAIAKSNHSLPDEVGFIDYVVEFQERYSKIVEKKIK